MHSSAPSTPQHGDAQGLTVPTPERPHGECPVVRGTDGTWEVRGHAEVLSVVTSPDVFSSRGRNHLHVPNGMDADEHRRFRTVIDRHLSDDRILALAPMVTAEANRVAIDVVTRATEHHVGAVEIVHEVGRRVAVRVQSRWLGWPETLEDELLEWIEDNFAATRSGVRSQTDRVAEHFDRIIRTIVADRRDQEALGEQPPDDPMTRLLHDMVEDPAAPGGERRLSEPEIVSILRNWTAGDLGSIAESIGVVLHYVAHPDNAALQEELRRLSSDEENHTEVLDSAVDEMLRINDPFPSNRRIVARTTELAGQLLEEGERVMVNWATANRDARAFDDPDDFRPVENRALNLVYGAGPHVCPGRLLSTLQIRGALTAVLRATTSLTLDPANPPVHRPAPSLGFDRVPVLVS